MLLEHLFIYYATQENVYLWGIVETQPIGYILFMNISVQQSPGYLENLI